MCSIFDLQVNHRNSSYQANKALWQEVCQSSGAFSAYYRMTSMMRYEKLDAAKMGINDRDGLPNGRSITCTVFVETAIRDWRQVHIVDSGRLNILQPTVSPCLTV